MSMCAHFFKRFRGLWTRCHFQFLGSGIHVKELQLILNPRRLKELRNGIGGSQEVESIYGRIDVRARDKQGDVSALAMSNPCYSTNFLISRNRCFEVLGASSWWPIRAASRTDQTGPR
jgi:hypothetical protein